MNSCSQRKSKMCSDKNCEHKGELQPLDNFTINRNSPDNHAYVCKECDARKHRASRQVKLQERELYHFQF
jgi:hypothetical protein